MILGNFENSTTLQEFYTQALTMYEKEYKSDFLLYYKAIEKLAKKIKSYKECGSFQGVSAAAAMIGNPELEYVEMIDVTFQHIKKHKKVYNDFKGKLFWNETSTLTCKVNEVDMTFIDSQHKYKHVIKEIQRHGPKTNKYLMFHDSYYHEIKRAIKETIDTGKWKYHTVNEKSFGYVVLQRI